MPNIPFSLDLKNGIYTLTPQTAVRLAIGLTAEISGSELSLLIGITGHAF